VIKEKKKKDKDYSDIEEEEEETEEKKKEKQKKPKKKREVALADGGAGNSFRVCAYTILKREGKALTATAIVKKGIKEGMISTTGKTPQNTLASVIYSEIKRDPSSHFVKVAPMTFGLKEWGIEGLEIPVDVPPPEPKTRKRKKKKAGVDDKKKKKPLSKNSETKGETVQVEPPDSQLTEGTSEQESAEEKMEDHEMSYIELPQELQSSAPPFEQAQLPNAPLDLSEPPELGQMDVLVPEINTTVM